MNFLEETKCVLLKHDHTLDDIIFVCDCGTHTRTSINDFINNANFNYNNGYGWPAINMDLLLIGKDFWLERHEYDGSEWWEYKSLPKVANYVKGEIDMRDGWGK